MILVPDRQILTAEGRRFHAQKHVKALRRYAHELRQNRPATADNAFRFFEVARKGRYQWADGERRLLMGMFFLRSSVSSGAGGSSDTYPYSYVFNKYVEDDASGSGDGSVGNPWTDEQAEANAIAADVVRWGAGVYEQASTGNKFTPSFKMANNGSSGSPIIFVAQNPAVYTSTVADMSRLSNGVTSYGTGGATVGVNGGDYQIWDGFYIDAALSWPTSDTGPCNISGSGNVGCEFRRMRIKGVGDVYVESGNIWNDNYNGIRLEPGVDCAIRDCLIYDFFSSQPGNDTAITCYGMSNSTIENCEIYNCGAGIFLKAEWPNGSSPNPTVPITGLTIQKNYIHDCNDSGINIGPVGGTSGSPSHAVSNIKQNICATMWSGIKVTTSESDVPAYLNLENNTCYNVSFGIRWSAPSTAGTQVSIKNNLISHMVAGSETGVFGSNSTNFDAQDANGQDVDYNFGSNLSSSVWGWDASNATQYTLANWRTRVNAQTDPDANWEQNSQTGTGAMVDPANEDFTLAVGHAARTASSTGGPVGAMITGSETIGIRQAA